MRIKLSLLLLVCTLLPALAQTGVKGTLVDAQSGKPVAYANVMLRDQALYVTSGSDGVFTISKAAPGPDMLLIDAYGFENAYVDVELVDGIVKNIGEVKMTPAGFDASELNSDDLIDESQILDDEDYVQNVGTIQGATDDIYYKTVNYYNPVRFRIRGLNSNLTTNYINGINFNDSYRGQFNFSGLGGMTSSAFRNKTVTVGSSAAGYGFGNVGGASNFTTYAAEYAPGFRANLSYTNSNYMLRAMTQYSTGVTRNGWAMSFSLIGRYSPQDVNPIPGTWYNSFGYALSIQKIFSDKHSLNLSTWGAPTQRAANYWTTQQAYDLAGNNLYNPQWGYQNGKKRSSRVVESFDPSVLLNWIWKPKMGTVVNTGVGFRHNAYSQTGLSWYNAPDPRPDYYRRLPYANRPTAEPGTAEYAQQLATFDLYTDLWRNDESFRQVDWDAMYQANYMNQEYFAGNPELQGMSSYIVEKTHKNLNAWMFNSYIDHRINDNMTLQGGVSFNYTDYHEYKTVDDLLGGSFWRDVDTFAERDFPGDANILHNDLNNPERHVKEGEVFGWDFNVRSIKATGWLQNQIVTNHWDVNYGLEISHTTFVRHGNMRNGRAPENSYGTGVRHTFDNAAVKVGATYKLNGRNYFSAHAYYGTRAPEPYNSYVQSRIKDDVVDGLASERILSGDIAYIWNYKNFRGSICGFYAHKWNGLETSYYYDSQYNTNMVYTLSGVETENKGIELGFQYKFTPSFSVSGVATYARYQYKNNPTGTKSYQNGAAPDIKTQVYLKNYFLGCTPQQAYTLALNYNTHGWFFQIDGNWFGDNYVYLSPTRHEAMPELYTICSSEAELKAKIEEITNQDKLNNAWVFNASIGKVVYTKWGALNFNLSVNNFTNNRNIQTSGKQEGRFDYTDYDINKFANKYYYAQGIRIYFNFGIRF